MTKREFRRALFYIGCATVVIAAANMAFQWFLQTTQSMPEKDFTHREAISSLFLLVGAYLAFTFKRKR